MPTAGPNYPSTAAEDSVPIGGFSFGPPEDALTADEECATSTGFGYTVYLRLTGFNFSLHPMAVVTGITVRIHRKVTFESSEVTDASIMLLIHGDVTGDDKASLDAWPSVLATATYGGSSDVWGLSGDDLSANTVNASDFGIAIAATMPGASGPAVDYATIELEYEINDAIGTTTSPGTAWVMFIR